MRPKWRVRKLRHHRQTRRLAGGAVQYPSTFYGLATAGNRLETPAHRECHTTGLMKCLSIGDGFPLPLLIAASQKNRIWRVRRPFVEVIRKGRQIAHQGISIG